VLLLLGLVSLATSKPSNDLADYVPVSIVTDADTSRAAIGQKNLPKPDKPKPLADKVGDLKQVEQVAPKVVNKPEITTNTTAPMPEPKPLPEPQENAQQKAQEQAQETAQQKPQPKSQDKAQDKPQPKPQDEAQEGPQEKPREKPKPDAKTAEKPEKKPAPFKADRIADLLKKTHPPQPREKPTPKTPKYNANQIAELLDHRAPQRHVATATALNSRASLGVPNAAPNAQLSQSEIDALRERLRECWSPPAGVNGNMNIYVSLRVLFKPDGSLAQMPVLVAGSPSPLGPALAESGKRALLLCQPFTMLRPEHYAQWRDITVDFDPRDLAGD
jgi:colicin import membrane protein